MRRGPKRADVGVPKEGFSRVALDIRIADALRDASHREHLPTGDFLLRCLQTYIDTYEPKWSLGDLQLIQANGEVVSLRTAQPPGGSKPWPPPGKKPRPSRIRSQRKLEREAAELVPDPRLADALEDGFLLLLATAGRDTPEKLEPGEAKVLGQTFRAALRVAQGRHPQAFGLWMRWVAIFASEERDVFTADAFRDGLQIWMRETRQTTTAWTVDAAIEAFQKMMVG